MRNKVDNETLAYLIEDVGLDEVLLEKGIKAEDLEDETLIELWKKAYKLAVDYENSKEETHAEIRKILDI